MEPEKWVVEENSLPMSKGPFSGSMLVFLGVCIYIYIYTYMCDRYDRHGVFGIGKIHRFGDERVGDDPSEFP